MTHQTKKMITHLKRHGVKKIALFGSVARGQAKRKSDIDVLVEFSRTPTLFEMARLQNELTRIMKKPVDLVTYNSLHPRLKTHILKDARLLYEKRS